MEAMTYKPVREALSPAELNQPDLHAGGFRAILDIARESLGAERVTAVLSDLGVSEVQVTDPTAWFSLRFAEELFERLVEAGGDPGLIDRAARALMSPKYMGPIYPLYRALGSPMFTYTRLMPTVRRTNRTGEYVVRALARGHVVVHFRLQPGFKEHYPWMCRMRTTLLTLGPVLFDLPAAQVAHDACLLEGAPECVYDVRWQERAQSPMRVWFVAAATVLGGGLALLRGLDGGVCAVFALLSGASTFAISSAYQYQRELRARVSDIEEHREALTRSEISAEKRYGELLEAKAEVDQKVEERTAELRETSDKLGETLLEVRALDRAKTDFFNNVSHELRTPLTLILAPLEDLMAGREPSGGAKVALAAMQRNAQRLLRLINQLLDLAKIDAGEMRLRPRLSDLRALVAGVLGAFELAAQRRSIRLTLDADPKLAQLSLDPSWIESALTNLVANALRFVPEGGEIRVRLEDHGNLVTMEVSDDGPGMGAQDAARIFERFAQGGDTHASRKGTGLGLAIVREALRLHGGDVALRTALGAGSTFTLTLPRRYDESTVSVPPPAAGVNPSSITADVDPREMHLRGNEVPEPSSSLRPGPEGAPLALVVEDNPDLRRHVADVLAVRYRVFTASNGAAGLEAARKMQPDVIVSDVAMPDMDGLQLARELRKDERLRHIPMLLVTARSDVSSVVEGFSAGASDYLVKPFHATELLARVDVHVRLRRMAGQLARQERLAALGSIAASVAHQVRNPLSALIAGLPAMRGRLGPQLDESTKDLMDVMLDCAQRIERLTIDLLDLSRIDREEHGELAPGAGLLSSTRILSSRIGSDMTLDTEVDERATITGRAGELNHVFMNLLDNAFRAAGSQGTIRVRGALEGANYVVRVEDSGPGVDAAVADRIFEPFWTSRTAGEGTGLGLAIARQIVEEHGGFIGVEMSSALGGAAFVVRLPISNNAA